jgi:hypothetical protein
LNSATRQPVAVVSDPAKAEIMLQCTIEGMLPMNKILKVLDRAALAIFNIMVIAGLPLAAVGLMTNAL